MLSHRDVEQGLKIPCVIIENISRKARPSIEHLLRRVETSQGPRSKVTHRAHHLSACVRICKSIWIEPLFGAEHKDAKFTVWVTACLSTQPFCRQKGFIGATNETKPLIDTSAGATSGDHAGRNPMRSRELAIDSVFKIHDHYRKASSIKEDSVNSETRRRLAQKRRRTTIGSSN